MAHPNTGNDTPGTTSGTVSPGPKPHHPRGLTHPAYLLHGRSPDRTE
jgi:hypothetical protein